MQESIGSKVHHEMMQHYAYPKERLVALNTYMFKILALPCVIYIYAYEINSYVFKSVGVTGLVQTLKFLRFTL